MAGLLFAVCALSCCAEPLLLIAAVLLHEGAHIAAAAALGWGLPRPAAGIAGLRLTYRSLASPESELCVLLAGPAANLIAAALFKGCGAFSLYCLGLGALNLLPVSGLDGGGALRAVCSVFCLPDTAHVLCRTASVTAVLLLWGLNAFIQMRAGVNITLLAVSVYLTVTVLSGDA